MQHSRGLTDWRVWVVLAALVVAFTGGYLELQHGMRGSIARTAYVLGLPVHYVQLQTFTGWKQPVLEAHPANTQLFLAINGARCALGDLCFSYLIPFGKAWVLLPILLAVYLYRRTMLFQTVLAQLFVLVATYLPKGLLSQPRPGLLLGSATQMTLMEDVFRGSFPSGDTLMAFALAATFAPGRRPWVQVLVYGYAALIGYERMYVGAHFPLDVLTGAVLGTLCGHAARWVVLRRERTAATHPA